MSIDQMNLDDMSLDQIQEVKRELARREREELKAKHGSLQNAWQEKAQAYNKANRERRRLHEQHKEAVALADERYKDLRDLRDRFKQLGVSTPTIGKNDEGFVDEDPT